MLWSLKPDRPIYLQLAEELRRRIIAGEYPPGGRLPAVRELAAEAAVNPNTMQRAMAELEGGGLVATQRTSGRSVTDDAEAIKRAREQAAVGVVADYFDRMRLIGFGRAEAAELIIRTEEEKDDE